MTFPSLVSGYIPLSAELAREMYERSIGPLHGPELPAPWALWSRLGGRPAGRYRRAS